jgi:hypothetical protein
MPTPTYTPLATVTLATTATSLTFSSIPSTYRDLVIVVDGTDAAFTNVVLRFNGDSGSNYSNVLMRPGVPPATASEAFTDNLGYVGQLGTSRGNTIIQIMDYSATDKHKTALGRGNVASTSLGAFVTRWANTSAITSVLVQGSTFQTGTTVNLYGIAS